MYHIIIVGYEDQLLMGGREDVFLAWTLTGCVVTLHISTASVFMCNTHYHRRTSHGWGPASVAPVLWLRNDKEQWPTNRSKPLYHGRLWDQNSCPD